MSINKKYVMAGMLATALVAPMTDATDSYADDTRTITGRVNFRTGPSKEYDSMGKIQKGEKVTYLGSSGSWRKIKYDSKVGYVHRDYISSGTSISSNEKYVNTPSGLNVRKGPSTSYSVITTLANGTKVDVLTTSGGWSKITNGSITGYVSNQYLSSSPSAGNTSNNNSNETSTTKYVESNISLNVRKGPGTGYSIVTTLSGGTKVTVKSTENGWSKIVVGNTTGYVSSEYLTSKQPSSGSSSSSSTSASASKVVSYAKQLLGKPYVWGAQGPNGFDCSGFTSYVFKKVAGISLPRTSSMQSNYGTYVSRSNLRAGDLVFFDTVGSNNGVVTHCGIYIGNGQLIHAASGQGKVVINNMNSSYYVNTYVNARRVL